MCFLLFLRYLRYFQNILSSFIFLVARNSCFYCSFETSNFAQNFDDEHYVRFNRKNTESRSKIFYNKKSKIKSRLFLKLKPRRKKKYRLSNFINYSSNGDPRNIASRYLLRLQIKNIFLLHRL